MSVSHCLLSYSHPNGDKDFVVSLFQALCLLVFGEKESWTATEIGAATMMGPDDLERSLQSLSVGKVKVLRKTPYTKHGIFWLM